MKSHATGYITTIIYDDFVNKFNGLLESLLLLINSIRLSNKLYEKKTVGYYTDIKHKSVCLVVNIFTVYSYGFLFYCTMVSLASDSGWPDTYTLLHKLPLKSH